MRRQAFLRTLCPGVLCAVLAMAIPAADAIAKSDNQGQGGKKTSQGQQRKQDQAGDRKQSNGQKASRGSGQMSAQDAARQAQQRYGGRVLKVDQRGSGYSVRLLQDDGRVITVTVGS